MIMYLFIFQGKGNQNNIYRDNLLHNSIFNNIYIIFLNYDKDQDAIIKRNRRNINKNQ